MIPRRLRAAIGVGLAIVALRVSSTHADEGGVSYWTPGQYGSFAAIAPSPGWSLPLVYYNYGGSKGASRVLPDGRVTGSLSGSLDGVFIVPTYTVGATILGAVPSFSMAFLPAYSAASASVGIGPLSLSRSDSVWGGQRPLSDRAALLEQGRRQQFHGLCRRRHPGRKL